MKTNSVMKSTFLKMSLTGLVVVCLSLNVLAKVAITNNLTDTTGKSKMKMEKMKSDKISSDKMAPKKMSDKKMSPKKMAKDSGKMGKM